MRRGIIEPNHPDLSIGQQCKLLSIARSSYYYEPKGETEQNLGLMRQIDEQFLETPFFGVRQMTWHLRNDGDLVNAKRIRRLMRLMGLMPIYQKPNTSRPAKRHKTYPYLLRGLRVDRPNQVWYSDITYLPMRRGFLYLVAIMDWHTARFCPGGSRTRCQRRLKNPQKCRSKIPHLHGSGDQPGSVI
ncbi:MAG: IS3 family transposase [Silicimonas sp.]